MRIAVLGCGWSGILVSIRMKTLYPIADVICVDKDFRGGLLNSEVVNGYLFDTDGSHVVFSKKREIIEGITMGGEWIARKREAYVLLNNTFIPYPFENGIYVLSPEDRVRYGLSLIKALINEMKNQPI